MGKFVDTLGKFCNIYSFANENKDPYAKPGEFTFFQHLTLSKMQTSKIEDNKCYNNSGYKFASFENPLQLDANYFTWRQYK